VNEGVSNVNPFLPITAATLAAASVMAFDANTYATLLQKYARGGKVNYAALKEKDSPALDRLYLGLADEKRADLAFRINAYNIIVLREATRAFPVKEVWAINKNFFKVKHPVAARQLSLDEIEHDIIIKEFHDPRIHFGVNCGSASCPILAAEPFTPENLDAKLDENARRFINDDANVRFEEARGVLWLSKLFDWASADFTREAGSVEKYLARYLTPDRLCRLQSRRWNIEHLPYDWSLNALK
jgi:hypothetical protein